VRPTGWIWHRWEAVRIDPEGLTLWTGTVRQLVRAALDVVRID
jgi:hypothetical protein